MEKESLISKLREKLGTTKLSDKTLDTYVSSVLPLITSDEMVNDAFLDSHVSVLSVMAGQISHDAAEEINRYKNEHPAQNQPPQATPQNPQQNQDTESIMQLLNEIKADNKSLKERLDKSEQSFQQDSIRGKVIEGMKNKGANDAYVLRNVLREVQFDTSKSVEELVELYLPNYDNEYKEAHGDGATPRNAQGGASCKGEEDLDKFFSEKAAEGKFPEPKKD